MNNFWGNLFEHLKNCGQNATLFLLALAAFFGLVIGTAFVLQPGVREHLISAFPWIGLLLVIGVRRLIIRARRRQPERLPRGSLSADELAKARGKLERHRKAKG